FARAHAYCTHEENARDVDQRVGTTEIRYGSCSLPVVGLSLVGKADLGVLSSRKARFNSFELITCLIAGGPAPHPREPPDRNRRQPSEDAESRRSDRRSPLAPRRGPDAPGPIQAESAPPRDNAGAPPALALWPSASLPKAGARRPTQDQSARPPPTGSVP